MLAGLQKFILPLEKKDYWQNCAELISALPDNIVGSVVSKLMIWLQDANWPSYETTANRLKQLSD